MEGFFERTSLPLVKKPRPKIAACGACGLYKGCRSPKMPYSGKGKKQILIIGEAPGAEEDEKNRQFIGKAGRHLEQALSRIGIDMRTDCWMTNSLICRPPNNNIKDLKWIEHCQPNVLNTIEELEPRGILLLGSTAVTSLIGYLWRKNPGGIGRWAGWKIPSQRYNAWIVPTWHPSYLLREKNPVLDILFDKHLKRMFEIKNHPWKTVPDYNSQVEIIRQPGEAARAVRSIIKEGGTIAFDYETNMLKPDSEKGVIVCVSVCHNGKRTIAFPWHGEAIEAMSDLLKDKEIQKIGYNLKFEQRWTRAKLGHSVRNWKRCGMTQAHVDDNRPQIVSLKFQAFVRLGQEGYDDHIRPFLKARNRGGYEENRVKEVPIADLLQYCGMDSLLEYKLWDRYQRRILCNAE